MANSRDNPMVWEEEGVEAYVPDQVSGIAPEIQEKGYVKHRSGHGFTVIRHLVNFCVKDAVTGQYINGFSPPMRIIVCYTQADLDAAGDVNHLKVLEWIKNRWSSMPRVDKNANCPVGKHKHIGAFEVLVTKRWADPEIAWGT